MAVNKVLLGNVKGPKGEKGDPGTPGEQGIPGEGIRGSRFVTGDRITGMDTTPAVYDTGIEDSLVNDQYMNQYTGDLYRCTKSGDSSTAEWVWTAKLKGDAYTKAESDHMYATKDDLGDVYTKTESDETFLKKTDSIDAYTKTESDETFLKKTDASSTYLTKTSADSTYATKTELNNIGGGGAKPYMKRFKITVSKSVSSGRSFVLNNQNIDIPSGYDACPVAAYTSHVPCIISSMDYWKNSSNVLTVATSGVNTSDTIITISTLYLDILFYPV